MMANAHNNSSIAHEHSIMVEMPSGISAKNSARTGNHFHKASYSGNKTMVMKHYNEESPPRISGGGMHNDGSHELLPNLNIKVFIITLIIIREVFKEVELEPCNDYD